MTSPLPLTNAFLQVEHVAHDGMWVRFAEELERENAQLRRELAEARAETARVVGVVSAAVFSEGN